MKMKFCFLFIRIFQLFCVSIIFTSKNLAFVRLKIQKIDNTGASAKTNEFNFIDWQRHICLLSLELLYTKQEEKCSFFRAKFDNTKIFLLCISLDSSNEITFFFIECCNSSISLLLTNEILML